MAERFRGREYETAKKGRAGKERLARPAFLQVPAQMSDLF